MNGLYRRALDIYRRRQQLRLVLKGDEHESMVEIPAEERENVLKEIDALLERNRLHASAERPSGGKSGLGLPLIVNLLIIISVVGAVLLFSAVSRGEENRLVSEARAVKGAENQLVEALRRESAAQIDQKDQAILSFQKRLAEAVAERERLDAQTADAIRQREKELAAEMAEAIEAERAKLSASGLASGDTDQRIDQLERELKAEAARRVEEFQIAAQEEAAKSAAAVDTLIDEYQIKLSEVQSERSELQKLYETREAELATRYRQESAVMEAEKSAAVADLERIKALREQEDLVQQRIIASYDEISDKIASGAYSDALSSVDFLRRSLDAEPARSLEAVQKRRSVELFMLGSLEELIKSRVERDSSGAAALIQTKARIDAARDKVTEAELAFAKGDYASAKALYEEALAEIPEVKLSQERLQALALAERDAALTLSHRAELAKLREELALTHSSELAEREKALSASYSAALASRETELKAAQAAAIAELDAASLSKEAAISAKYEAELASERAARLAAEEATRTEIRLAAERLAELEAELKNEYEAALSSERAARLAAEEAASREIELAEKKLAALEAKLAAESAVALEKERAARLIAEESARLAKADAAAALARAAEIEASLGADIDRERAGRIAAETALADDRTLAAERAAALEEKLGETRRVGSALIADAAASASGGAWGEALDRYREALGLLLDDEETAASIVEQASMAGYRLGIVKDAAARAVLPARIAQARKDLEAVSSDAGEAEGQSGTIASLLRAKLLLWQVLQTEPIKSRYPDLYDSMEAYFETFANQQRQAGREAALMELLTLVEAISGESSASVDAGASGVLVPTRVEHDILSRLLLSLEKLTMDQADSLAGF